MIPRNRLINGVMCDLRLVFFRLTQDQTTAFHSGFNSALNFLFGNPLQHFCIRRRRFCTEIPVICGQIPEILGYTPHR